ncbi:hypothetical protein H5P28_04245 [Ruficoccus amylovorans]|uniref:Alpha-L-rhamnosidase six-hairpin glycosidase domain-containing protein n=1 Tax=Ruficoccus amylovorans TaxID=1804625 RepID=A0A842HAS8_9BACT|nr:hypothetical protein [Ruficoccus amylovorans]MBC2593465.1 hypothetical protein [Ruficoccus amylovorans]
MAPSNISQATRITSQMRQAECVWSHLQHGSHRAGQTLIFYCELSRQAGARAELRIAATDSYRVWLDDVPIAQGPARTAPGYARIDQIPITPAPTTAHSLLAIEVAWETTPRFDRASSPAFLAAEWEEDGKIVAATGVGKDWKVVQPGWRLEAMEKFSAQRGRIEAMRFHRPACYINLRASLRGFESVAPTTLCPEDQPRFLPRRAPLPLFSELPVEAIIASGDFSLGKEKAHDMDFWWKAPEYNEPLRRLALNAQAVDISGLLERISETKRREAPPPSLPLGLQTGQWALLGFGRNATGFLDLEVYCERPVSLLATFDEVLTDGSVSPSRNKCHPAFYWELCSGHHRLRTFEPQTLQYLQLWTLEGSIHLERIDLVEMTHPCPRPRWPNAEPKMQPILEASWQTFRQNAIDIFMDCPGRERAGWLCDSFFTARAEYLFTGCNAIETDFLENFLLAETYENIPAGMLPMCWPADNPLKMFIPQWALWFILEICETPARSGNDELVEMAQQKTDGIFQWFSGYLNSEGFLENLPGWNFVEWSKSNDLTTGVNFPTQFLYAAALIAAGRTYSRDDWVEAGQSLRQRAAERSFDGEWFHDQALRKDDGLTLSAERTETCQYYAFFFGAASPQTTPTLWQRLVKDFGPLRNASSQYPEIFPSNAFIGNILRFECLKRHGESKRLSQELLSYYAPMAESTGTLWEHSSSKASCNHGFASYIACLMDAAPAQEPPFLI